MLTFFIIAILVLIEEIARGYRKAKNKKKYAIKTSMGLVVILLLLFLAGPFFIISPVKPGYSSIQEGGITVYYPSSRPDLVQDVLEKSKKAAQTNEQFYQIPAKIKILVAASALDMLRFGSYPKAGGTATELGITVRDTWVTENVLTHEMSHKNLRKTADRSALSIPRWFDEGLASYLGKMDYYKTINELGDDLEAGLYKRDIIKWQGLVGMLKWHSTVFFWNKNPRLIYGQTYLMVKYLFDAYGQDKVHQLIISLKDNSFDNAFIQTFEITPEQFHQNFINFVENHGKSKNSG